MKGDEIFVGPVGYRCSVQYTVYECMYSVYSRKEQIYGKHYSGYKEAVSVTR
jgi:hypothetical protein